MSILLTALVFISQGPPTIPIFDYHDLMKLILSLLMLMLSLSAFSGETVHKLRVQSKDGKFHKIKAASYINAWGRPEVRLEATAIPSIVKGINPILGFGRDLDDDGKIESWFMYNSREGFKVHVLNTKHIFGFDAVQSTLFKQYSTSVDMYANVAAIVLVSYVSMAANNLYSSQIEYAQELFDLHEIGVRLRRGQSMEKKTLNVKQVRLIGMLLHEGLRRAQEKLKNAEGKQFMILTAVDVGIWLSSAKIVQLLGKGARIVGGALLATAEGQYFAAIIKRFISHKMAYITSMSSQVMKYANIAVAAVQNSLFKKASHAAFKGMLSKVARALVAKNRLYTMVGRSALKAAQFAYRWDPNWKMTLVKRGTVTTMSLALPHKEIKASSYIKDILGQEEVKNNILAAADTQENKKVSAQVIGMADMKSKTITFFGEQKAKETLVKASWKVGPLSYIDMADSHAMDYLETATIQSGKPGLQLVGYMIVVVNEIGMDHVKGKVEQGLLEGDTVLVPITVAR